jgi:hypothetical protein
MHLFEYWLEGFSGVFARATEGKSSAHEKISASIEISAEVFTGDPVMSKAYLEFFNMMLKDAEFATRMFVIFEEYVTFFSDIIAEGIAAGEFADVKPEPAAAIIISLLDGLLLRAFMDENFDTRMFMEYAKIFIFRALTLQMEEQE